jgi:glycosyltransferase involved in cell wall biosynthesis/2-polyprenyl-3-methyl-5-hydroxy-6-metoxy-1,4-benzoquinol methylase
MTKSEDTHTLPNVSVIIPAHNRVDVLRRVLRALQQQTYPNDLYEVIVVDDFSEPPLQESLEEDSLFENARLLRNQVNLGDRRSRDAGVAAARGELVILLDSDMVVCRDFISSHVDEHVKYGPGYAITGHHLYPEDLPNWTMAHSSVISRDHRMREIYPDAPIRSGATTANMSLWKSDYHAAQQLCEERWRQCPEYRATHTVYGWKDIEFNTALVKSGILLRYSLRAWSYHYDAEPFKSTLCKRFKVGIGTVRFTKTFPEEVDSVLTQAELEWVNLRCIPTLGDLAVAYTWMMLLKLCKTLGMSSRYELLSGRVLRFFNWLGVVAAACGLQRKILDTDVTSVAGSANLVLAVQRRCQGCQKITLGSRAKMVLPTPFHTPARWLYCTWKFPFQLLHQLARFVATGIDHILNQFTPREFIMRKESSKYDYYFQVEGHVSDVGYRFAVDKVCQLLNFRSVLDVGCAQGFAVNEFLRRGYKVNGCDISKYIVTHPIRELWDKKVLFHAQASNLPFGDKSFHLVFCTDVMEHIPKKDVLPSIYEMKRIASRYLFFTICLHPSTHRNIIEYHATVLPRSWWEDRFAEAGLHQLRELESKIQGSEKINVGGRVVPVEYFIYANLRVR